jgi:hypothetical protein
MRWVRERISSINKFKSMMEVVMNITNFELKFITLARMEKSFKG